MTFIEVLQHFPDAKRNGSSWQARCPVHEPPGEAHNPSLSIREGEGGRTLLHCHAGCGLDEICATAGITKSDLFPERNGNRPSKRIVAIYDYCDETGKLLYQKLRYEPKSFVQRKPNGRGGWEYRLEDVHRVLYRLPELLAANPGDWVFVCEGEKDVDNLAGIGLVATCNCEGAAKPGQRSKWREEYSNTLKGRKVCFIADKDDAGRAHAAAVAEALRGKASRLVVIELPGEGVKDASDWLNAHDSTEPEALASRLLAMAEAAAEPEPQPAEPASGPVLVCLADVEPREVQWLWPGRVPLGRITLLVGRPGEGKSFLTIDMAARVTRGFPFPDGSPCPSGSVILVNAEDDPGDTVLPRCTAAEAGVNRIHLLRGVVHLAADRQKKEAMFTLQDVGALEMTLQRVPDCKLVVIDPIGSFLGGRVDAHRDNEVRAVLAPVAKLAERHGVAVLVVAHRRKSTGSIADDLALGSRAFTGIARAVWHLTRDPENKARRLLLPGKNNLAAEGDGLAFTIDGAPPRLFWESAPVNMSADDALAAEANREKPGPEAEAREAAAEWLRQALAAGPRLARDVGEEAREAKDISRSTLRRAREDVGVIAYRNEIPGPWLWKLPDNQGAHPTCSPPRKEKHLEHLEHLGATCQKRGFFHESAGPAPKVLKLEHPEHLDPPHGNDSEILEWTA